MADQSVKPAETPAPAVEYPKPPVPETVGAGLGVEVIETAERESDRTAERVTDKQIDAEPAPAEPIAPIRRAPPVVVSPAKDKTLQKIEDILGEDLTDAFLAMPPDRQKAFKEKGEETASRIKQMIDGAKVSAKKIFDMIRAWLKLVPGINRFFLEQEAKIKTDKILKLKT